MQGCDPTTRTSASATSKPSEQPASSLGCRGFFIARGARRPGLPPPTALAAKNQRPQTDPQAKSLASVKRTMPPNRNQGSAARRRLSRPITYPQRLKATTIDLAGTADCSRPGRQSRLYGASRTFCRIEICPTAQRQRTAFADVPADGIRRSECRQVRPANSARRQSGRWRKARLPWRPQHRL